MAEDAIGEVFFRPTQRSLVEHRPDQESNAWLFWPVAGRGHSGSSSASMASIAVIGFLTATLFAFASARATVALRPDIGSQLRELAGRLTLQLRAKLPKTNPEETRERLRKAFFFTPNPTPPVSVYLDQSMVCVRDQGLVYTAQPLGITDYSCLSKLMNFNLILNYLAFYLQMSV